MTSPDSADDARRRGHSRPSTVLVVVLVGAAVLLGIVAVISRIRSDADTASRAAVWIDHAGVHIDGRTFALRVSSPTVLTLTSAGAVYGTAHDYWLQPRDGAARRIPVGGVPTGNPNGSVIGWIKLGKHAVVFHAYDVATGKVVTGRRFAVGFRFASGDHLRLAEIPAVLSINGTTAYLRAAGRIWRYPGRTRGPGRSVEDRAHGRRRRQPGPSRADLGAGGERHRPAAVRADGLRRTGGVNGFTSASGLSPDGRSYLSGGFRGSPHGGFAPPVVFDTSTGHARPLKVGTGTTSGVAWGYRGSMEVAVDVIAPNDAYVRTNVWVCSVRGSCARIGTVDRVHDLLLPGGPG